MRRKHLSEVEMDASFIPNTSTIEPIEKTSGGRSNMRADEKLTSTEVRVERSNEVGAGFGQTKPVMSGYRRCSDA
jgi:hypothetical protein